MLFEYDWFKIYLIFKHIKVNKIGRAKNEEKEINLQTKLMIIGEKIKNNRTLDDITLQVLNDLQLVNF